jgi:BlaI family penicillinase repressor
MKAENHNPPKIRELTRLEEQVMQALWDLGKGLVREVLDHFPDPKPAYTTISTIIRILEQKGFVNHKAYGRTYEYYPLISRKEYTRFHIRNLVGSYFGNSYRSLASFFVREERMSIAELEEIREMLREEIDKKKEGRHE